MRLVEPNIIIHVYTYTVRFVPRIGLSIILDAVFFLLLCLGQKVHAPVRSRAHCRDWMTDPSAPLLLLLLVVVKSRTRPL